MKKWALDILDKLGKLGNMCTVAYVVSTPLPTVENCGCKDKKAAEKDKQDASEEKRE